VSPVRYELGFYPNTAFFIVTTLEPEFLHSVKRLGSAAET
jgi:hypothetical protein